MTKEKLTTVRRHPNLACPLCGTEFYLRPSSIRVESCCSRACFYDHLKGKYRQNPAKCAECLEPLPFKKKKHTFCSSKCYGINLGRRQTGKRKINRTKEESLALRREWTKQHLLKKNNGVIPPKKKYRTDFHSNKYSTPFPHTSIRRCEACSKFHAKTTFKYCNDCHPNVSLYRSRAKFTVNVYEYPDEFDLTIIDKIGWYSPTGRLGKNMNHLNLSGASRDHLFTISDGFKLGVDPKILAHPANCQVIAQCVNSSKARRSSNLTLEELLVRISNWELKYGKYSSR